MEQAVRKDRGWVILAMPERYNAASAQEFEPTLAKVLAEPDPLRLLLDFATVRYVDSTGIGSLIRLFGTLKQRHGQVAAANCRDNVAKIFKLVNLQRYIPLYATLEDALGSAPTEPGS